MGKVQKLEQVAYLYIRRQVLGGEWSDGYHIVESSLSDHLDVSRSPVRSALRVLADEGTVQDIPYRGYFVKGVDKQDSHLGLELRFFQVLAYRILDHMEKHASKTWQITDRLNHELDKLDQAYVQENMSDFITAVDHVSQLALSLAANDFMKKSCQNSLMTICQHVLANQDNQAFKELTTPLYLYFKDFNRLLLQGRFIDCKVVIDLLSAYLYQLLSDVDQAEYDLKLPYSLK
ncbi:hypothetical protein AWM75_05905 [Aerococcus urinaehominis]|uniref:Uncharacterized protein n=1 Tax=Aerococcus urinaehominis TaxID=128944 RepID=A0A0X8FLK0_9LACT|nr:GntR family transcriptional regulator [Aerococcus urinaehominis]AMB99558.1 hypothetical protein AWM75_05905 [Aerococcus urinaehominis]SDM35098.1 regulatory protein, gntR family [Aerococcus urinaehominis]